MTPAQLERNSNAGKACYKKYGQEFYATLGKKGGSRPKAFVYKAPEALKITKGGKPLSYSEKLRCFLVCQIS